MVNPLATAAPIRWQREAIEDMLEELVTLKNDAKMTDSYGFEASDLSDVARILSSKGHSRLTCNQIRSKHDDLKKQ